MDRNIDLPQLVAVGQVIGCHGVRGEVRVIPLTDYPDRFFDLKKVAIVGPQAQQTLTVETVRRHKGWFLIKFKEISDQDGAEKLRQAYLKITPTELVPLPPGHYYIFQMIGLVVYTDTGESLGTVAEVLTPGGNDVYVVRHKDRPDLLIPAIKDVVKSIDLPAGKMIVKLPPGLRD